MSSKIVSAGSRAQIRRAAALLRKGRVVAFPTETVYGLGADALNPRAVCRIFEAKRRPRFDPLIVHVAAPWQALRLWRHVPGAARRLMESFWPGPLTLVLPKSGIVPDIVTAGLDTVAVRMPAHPVALELIRECGRPLAAPSANLFGYTSATSARSVYEDLGTKVDLILDAGPTPLGIESTVVRVVGSQCLLLRPGSVPVEAIKRVVPVFAAGARGRVRESPGRLKVHYAPRTPLMLTQRPWKASVERLLRWRRQQKAKGGRWPRLGLLLFEKRKIPFPAVRVEVLSRRGDLYEAASNLFQAIRKLDKMKLHFILAEAVQPKGIGLAVMDRLQKASGGRRGLALVRSWIRGDHDDECP